MGIEQHQFPVASASRAFKPRWRPGARAIRTRFYAALLGLDLACIALGFFVASILYVPRAGGEHWTLVAAVLFPIYAGIALSAHAYSVDTARKRGGGVIKALQALCLAAGVMVFVAVYLRASGGFSRVVFGLGTGLSLALLAVGRDLFLRNVADVIGGNPFSVAVIRDDDGSPSTEGASIVIHGPAIAPHEQSPAMYDRLAKAVRDADRVIVECPPERREMWARTLKGAAIQGEIVAPELHRFAPLGLDGWSGHPTIIIAKGPLNELDAGVKRLFDLVVAGLATLLLAPFLLLVALAIKLDSRGPVLFVQTRIGRGNEMFRMYKFRSMRTDLADQAGARLTNRDDDRVTRVGRFIRATSIDELPQLLNVLRGDMSIVGPRPHPLGALAEDKLYWEIDDRYWHRHAAKPGLTGLAQVRGYRGTTVVERDLTDRLQADLEYLNNWSVWKDMRIVLLTFKVLVHRNAF